MRLLDGYIGRTVSAATLMVFLALIALDVIFSLIDQLDDMENQYQIPQVLWYTLLSTPTRLYDYIPTATFIGCLVGLGLLSSTSELTVIRASGVSLFRILYAVTKPLLWIMLASLLLGEYAVPFLERKATNYRKISQGGNHIFTNRAHGYWHREANTFMRFSAIEPNGTIYGLTLYELTDQQGLNRIISAQKAAYTQNQGWHLENVVIRELTPAPSIKVHQLPSFAWTTKLTPDKLDFVAQSPAFMGISTLYQYFRYLENEGVQANEYRLAFWKKLLQPFSTFALVLLSISFIFGALRSVSMGQRLFTGIMAGIGYKFAVDLIAPAGVVAGASPVFSNSLPIVLCMLLGGYLLKRTERQDPILGIRIP